VTTLEAAFLPARRAMTHQLTDTNGAPVVRERYWITINREKSVPAPVVMGLTPPPGRTTKTSEQARGVAQPPALLEDPDRLRQDYFRRAEQWRFFD